MIRNLFKILSAFIAILLFVFALSGTFGENKSVVVSVAFMFLICSILLTRKKKTVDNAKDNSSNDFQENHSSDTIVSRTSVNQFVTIKRKCPYCSSMTVESSKYCSNCGNELLLICPYCEKENATDATCCLYCGKTIEK